MVIPAGVLLPLFACAMDRSPPSGDAETITIRVGEGTRLGFDLSPDGRKLVFDLLGQLWEVAAEGGDARPLTHAVRDTAEDLDPSYAPDGRVVFRGERTGRTGIWLLTPGEPAPQQLTQLPRPEGYEGNAAWSPDGKTIAFVRVLLPDTAGPRPRSGIALMDPATGSTRELRIEGIPAPGVRDPAWEPGGRRIAVVAGSVRAPRGGRIWIVAAAGGTAAPLTAETVQALAPAFAPDGNRIAFFAPDSADLTQVWVLDLRSAKASPRRLTSHADVSPTRVRWSADGGELFYSADGRLWRIPAAGGTPAEIPFTAELALQRPRRLLPQARFPEPGKPEAVRAFSALTLSPDARNIGMIALGKLWVMPVGEQPRAVADLPRTARYLAWSADGARVAWSAGRPGEEDLFATDLSGGATHRITALPGREVFPAYSSDGRHLAFVHQQPERRAYLRVAEAGIRELSDSAPTRILDSIDLSWTASDADTPQWTPQSDGLLYLSGGWAPNQPTRGAIARLSGASSKLGRMPDSPLFLRWTDKGITFVRHARLWRAPFDSSGMLGPAEPLGSDPAMYSSAAKDGTVLYISEGGLRLRAPDGQEQRLGWPLSYTPPVAPPLLIRNARIIDGTGSPVTAPRDILIEGGRITRIDQPGGVDSSGRAVLDAGGRFIMPGLMDLHAHEYRPDLLPGFLYFGVMTVRDQGAPLAPQVAAADAIAAGVFDGPRVGYGAVQFYTDWAYDTDDGLGIEPETDPEHATRSVALAAAFGAQHIKTRTFRRWDINARLIAEAHRRGMRATGHCGYQLPLVAAGMDAQEHSGFCDARGSGYIYDDLVQLFRAADIALVPTISYLSFAQRMTRPDLLDSDQELAPFLPERSSFGWMVGLNPEVRRGLTRGAERARQATLKLARAGVTIGTGTDIWQMPAGVHMELEELVAAGLTPLEAIRAATGSAARILGAEQDLGTIEVGKWADLVVLDADPVADIRNTRKIQAIVQAGRLVDRPALLERFGKF
jgi:Tol biopolymer transport system component